MLTTDHPDEERLSAHAAGETEAPDHESLTLHLAVCGQCQGIVRDLRGLRTALAQMPDVVPSRPLQLLPIAEEPTPSPAERLAEWARRLFAPALTAGAALAMVGLVGTTLPTLSGMGGQASSASDAAGGTTLFADESEAAGEMAPLMSDDFSNFDGAGSAASSPRELAPADEDVGLRGQAAEQSQRAAAAEAAEEDAAGRTAEEGAGADRVLQAPAERSPWPMLLFAGVALMIGAALLRWILVPRAA